MKRYRVVGRLARIHSGKVEISDKQARDRMHCLEHIGDGVYEVLKPIEFKAGEMFGYDSTTGKGQADFVEDQKPSVDDKPGKPEAKAPPVEKKEKPKAEAKHKK